MVGTNSEAQEVLEGIERQFLLKDAGIKLTNIGKQQTVRLRGIAETLLNQNSADIRKMSASSLERLVTELNSYQKALETQNTDLSRIQAELEESRNKLSDLYDFMPVGYFTFDQNYLIIDANSIGAEILAVQRNSLLAKTFIDFIAPDCRDDFIRLCNENINNNKTQKCQLKLVKGNGCEFYAELDSLVVRESDRDNWRIRISVTDISERRRTIEEIIRLAAIVESSNDAIISTDLNGMIISWNWAAEKIFGYHAAEILNKPFSMLLDTNDVDVMKKILRNLKEKKSIDHFEAIHLTKENRQIHVSLTVSPIKNADGNVVGASTITRDITERKLLEKAMLEYQQKLRRQASQLSLAEERERRRIATDLHDNVIQSLALSMIKLDLLCDSDNMRNDKLLGEISNTLRNAIEDMRNMTFDISSPTLYKFGLSTAIDELLDDLIYRRYSIEYEFYDDNEQKPLDEDVRVLLFQSVRELLINVIKHADADKVDVRIEKEGSTVRVEVTDDGAGFDVEDNKLDIHRSGGFGLFNIRERLDYIGGAMEIQSQPGKGSRFVLIAPLKTGIYS